jgi:hypothetical protein
MKLCIEGDIYFIPKFHILETETVKLSIETGLMKVQHVLVASYLEYVDWNGTALRVVRS